MQNYLLDAALIVVDVQNDFCEGGSLEVPNASVIIPKINGIKQLFKHVIFTKDWHPQNHVSFKSNHQNLEELTQEEISNLWPVHCVQNTFGSEFHKNIVIDENDIIVLKGQHPNFDSYSGFGCNQDPTILHETLQKLNVKHLFICGLALDYCVLSTVIDALKHEYQVFILEDCCQSIFPDQVKQKIHQKFKGLQLQKENLKDHHLQIIQSNQILQKN